MVNIKGLSKARVLMALWNGSRAQGMSFMGLPGKPMKLEGFEEDIKVREEKGLGLYFDYHRGKVIKCDLAKDTFNPRLYDRDSGEGAAEMAVLAEFTDPDR